MARKGISYEMVSNAAAAIKARGAEPTISAVRVELNNEGSFSTISQHLAKWREQDAEKVDIRSLPEVVENAALTAITTIWNVANKEAREEIAAIKEDYKADKKRMQAEYDELLKENKVLEDALEEATEAGKQDRTHLTALEKKLTAVNSELETTKKLYAELLASIRPQAASAPQAADTKSARRAGPKAEPEKTPGDGQAQK